MFNRVITVRWRASFLSLGSDDGISVLVSKRGVPKIKNLYSTIQYGGYLILLACEILGIFRYKKSEVDIQINTEA